jgi:hypothetical protein
MAQHMAYVVPTAARYYNASAWFDPLRLGITLPNAVVVSLVLAGVYAYAEVEVSDYLLRAGGTVVMGIAMGILSAAVIHLARVNQRALAVLIATFLGLVALWASWVVWVKRVLLIGNVDIPLSVVATRPWVLFRLIRFINTRGVWSYNGEALRGGLLWFYWIGEALIVVAGCASFAAMTGTPAPYCRQCHRTCKPVRGMPWFRGEDVGEVRSRLEINDFDYLLALGEPEGEESPTLKLEMQSCKCGETNLLCARQVVWEFNTMGLKMPIAETLVRNLQIGREQAAQVYELKSRLEALRETDDSAPATEAPAGK